METAALCKPIQRFADLLRIPDTWVLTGLGKLLAALGSFPHFPQPLRLLHTHLYWRFLECQSIEVTLTQNGHLTHHEIPSVASLRPGGHFPRIGWPVSPEYAFGYNQVPLSVCRRILEALPRSEIILTFAIDWLIDYLSENTSFLKAMAPIEITEDQVKRFLETKGLRGHRYLVQRLVMKKLQIGTGASYFTPFFIRSNEAGRDLWLIHLSKHPTARNVMTSSHWAIQNASLHQGKAGLNMLGFDPHWENAPPLDFEFDLNAEAQIAVALRNDIPYRVEALDSHGPVTFDAFQRAIANDTAARIDQVKQALMALHDQGDIKVLTPSGQLKRLGAQLKNTDRLQIPRQLFLPGVKIT